MSDKSKPTDKSLKDRLIDAAANSRFLDEIDEQNHDLDSREGLPARVVSVHNSGEVNVIAEYGALEKHPARDFFQIRRVLEKALPDLEADLIEVMRCVTHLTHGAGDDLMAGSLLPPYGQFCTGDPSRPSAALDIIAADIQLIELLSPTLVAGSGLDEAYYWQAAIDLLDSDNADLTKRAAFALGKLHYSESSSLPERSIELLANLAVGSSDDELCAAITQAAHDLLQIDSDLLPRVVALTDTVISNGGDVTLYTASHLFGLYTKEIPNELRMTYVSHLARVKSDHQGTINNIDLGLTFLLAQPDPDVGIGFLESMMSGNRELRISAFDSAASELLKNREQLLSRLATRWFARGSYELCRIMQELMRLQDSETSVLLEIVPTELVETDLIHLLFIARKSAGYLFFSPVTAASLIVSLLQHATDAETKDAISGLLFETLLINYPHKTRTYLESIDGDDSLKDTLQSSIDKLDQYLKALEHVNDIQEHRSSIKHRESFFHHMSTEMSQAMKEAESNSVILSLVSRSVLLYGQKSIRYLGRGQSEPADRMVTPLQGHSVEMEVPRYQNLDPLGLELMLRRFKLEQIIQ
ncbi:MAG: hypothetical protein JJ957_13740 [Pseudomonadales bacterium]|nr:hypothetical protein [Pseudomonadales bacterium]MBO6596620.1 hypothetical protein [Pseudomonadales bacterium]MBO6823391.1 hypothetical protein [Pseudomonadales bacterium]